MAFIIKPHVYGISIVIEITSARKGQTPTFSNSLSHLHKNEIKAPHPIQFLPRTPPILRGNHHKVIRYDHRQRVCTFDYRSTFPQESRARVQFICTQFCGHFTDQNEEKKSDIKSQIFMAESGAV